MSLSFKAELEIWASALKAYDEKNLEQALKLFSLIADSSKILTNMGLIYATIGDHETAAQHFYAATDLDSYLAIAHFQCGVSNFLLERYDLALLNFEETYFFLRGNEAINYEQIGLKFKLFSAEILFNKGLTQINLGFAQEGMADMQEASRQKVTDEHNVIDDAIRKRGQGYTVFSIRLIAASDSNDAFTEFTGVKRLEQASETNPEDKEYEKNIGPESSLTRSAIMPAPRSSSVYLRISVYLHRADSGTDSTLARRIPRSETALQIVSLKSCECTTTTPSINPVEEKHHAGQE
ncbi:hypothetical protein JVU11DRAFT_4271 [Chiua virens]|nr:hypothetical protein JVU11DRAFT_4271 [Chiua virens]